MASDHKKKHSIDKRRFIYLITKGRDTVFSYSRGVLNNYCSCNMASLFLIISSRPLEICFFGLPPTVVGLSTSKGFNLRFLIPELGSYSIFPSKRVFENTVSFESALPKSTASLKTQLANVVPENLVPSNVTGPPKVTSSNHTSLNFELANETGPRKATDLILEPRKFPELNDAISPKSTSSTTESTMTMPSPSTRPWNRLFNNDALCIDNFDRVADSPTVKSSRAESLTVTPFI
mmetsp:Transcript_23587/g.33886  ORF Transcript_23587/g.33886 Transcript_23587/m.33886 type:complete len:235 (-) Transcript_23587:1911-2615(-)